jgi:hypothetical protein
MSHFSIDLQLIYVNSFFDMHIWHINTKIEHVTSISNVTSVLNQHNRGLIGRFTPKRLSFNLTHNQSPQFYILTHVLYLKYIFILTFLYRDPPSFLYL